MTYKPFSKQAVLVTAELPSDEQSSIVPNASDNVKEETWDSEQTGNFARKLGFLDSEKEGGEMVKPFLQINEVCKTSVLYITKPGNIVYLVMLFPQQVANKILEVLLKLRELGYPLHLAEAAKNGLKCNTKEADRMVGVSLLMVRGVVISMALYERYVRIKSYG